MKMAVTYGQEKYDQELLDFLRRVALSRQSSVERRAADKTRV